jgi:hypothetical protein
LTINGELECISKEVVMAFLEVLSRNLSGGIEENHEESSVRIVGLWDEI